MRHFAYVGEGGCVLAFGHMFPHGVPVPVDPDAEPGVVRKLEGNRFFAEVIQGVEIIDAPVKRKPGRPKRTP